MMRKIYFAAVMTLFLLPGCFFSSGTPRRVQEYDLGGINSGQVSAIPVELGAFINISGAGTKMLFREKDGSLYYDEECRYAALPEQLLLRKFTEIFPGAGEKKIRISGKLLRFEIHRSRQTAVFSAEFTLRKDGKSRNVVIKSENILKNNTPGGAAEAMERSIIAAGKKLAAAIAEFNGNGGKK